MANYRHTDQRPLHLLRHGPLHLVRHLRADPHGHRRTVVDPEDRIRNSVIYAGIAGALIIARGTWPHRASVDREERDDRHRHQHHRAGDAGNSARRGSSGSTTVRHLRAPIRTATAAPWSTLRTASATA